MLLLEKHVVGAFPKFRWESSGYMILYEKGHMLIESTYT